MSCVRCGLEEPVQNTECFRDDKGWACARLPRKRSCDVLADGTLLLVAPAPDQEFQVGEDVFYLSDRNQVIRNVLPEHFTVLTEGYKCSLVRPIIVANSFPEGCASVHCYRCGAFVEMPEGGNRQVWMRDGVIIAFVAEHSKHAEDWVLRPPSAPSTELFEFKGQVEKLQHLMVSGGPPSELTISQKLPTQEDEPRVVVMVRGVE